MNNNKTDETALLSHGKGVFSKASFITIGTKEQPEVYGLKDASRSNFSGKQFLVAATKKGRAPNSYFTKKHEWIADGDVFIDRTRFAATDKAKLKGFLTSDFERRDEFSNTIRTGQWREQLKQERKFAKASLENIRPTEISIAFPTKTTTPVEEDEISLYDRVYEKTDNSKQGRSKTHTGERNMGGMTTTYSLTHQKPMTFQKPQFARKPIIRDTFYRKMNVPFGKN